MSTTNPYVDLRWSEAMIEPPMSNGVVREHREVAARMLGRRLADGEVVHHKDEDKTNNQPSNLMVFSSHADHARFHRGGILVENGDGTYSSYLENDRRKCACGKSKDRKAALCINCHLRVAARNIPTKEQLEDLVWKLPSTKIGPMFGVSDRMVGKWCAKYGITKPPPGYWAKNQAG